MNQDQDLSLPASAGVRTVCSRGHRARGPPERCPSPFRVRARKTADGPRPRRCPWPPAPLPAAARAAPLPAAGPLPAAAPPLEPPLAGAPAPAPPIAEEPPVPAALAPPFVILAPEAARPALAAPCPPVPGDDVPPLPPLPPASVPPPGSAAGDPHAAAARTARAETVSNALTAMENPLCLMRCEGKVAEGAQRPVRFRHEKKRTVVPSAAVAIDFQLQFSNSLSQPLVVRQN